MNMNLLDIIFIISALAAVLSACHRGLGKEVLHTLLFGGAVAGGAVFFLHDSGNTTASATPQEIARTAISILFYLIAMYVFVWGAVKFISPLILDNNPKGYRSQFWAGALSALKIAATILTANLWYALHSVEAHPLRLTALPLIMQRSVVVQLSDMLTDKAYATLVQYKALDAETFDAKIKDTSEQDSKLLEGITTPPPTPDYKPAQTIDPLPPVDRPESYD